MGWSIKADQEIGLCSDKSRKMQGLKPQSNRKTENVLSATIEHVTDRTIEDKGG